MNVQQLYDIYDTLSAAGGSISEHSKEYKEAINATRLGLPEKKLSIQIITKYFGSFPEQQNSALNAIIDLCEFDDKQIRIMAMKSFPSMCKESPLYISQCAEIVGQMLQVDDPMEQTCVTNVFIEILKKDPLRVIKSIFKIIHDPTALPLIRFRCMNFILTKIKVVDSSLVTDEVQNLLISLVKETLTECIADEFVVLMNYLVSTPLVNTLTGQKEITDIVMQQIEIGKDFLPYQPKCNFTNRLVSCVKFILPFYSAKVESTELVQYYCNKVFDQWDVIGEINNGLQYQTAIAQQLATMAPFCGTLETPTKQVETIYNTLKLYLPEPPETTSSDMPEFNFTMIESLLFAFHALVRQCPDFLTENPALQKDIRARLMYVSRGVQGCLNALAKSPPDAGKALTVEEKRVRDTCPALLNNILNLVKDIYRSPPVFKCKVALSFAKKDERGKPPAAGKKAPALAAEPANAATNKRHQPITFDSSNGASANKKRVGPVGDKKLYVPPIGKSSPGVHRGRGGGGFRGRGRGGYRGGYRN